MSQRVFCFVVVLIYLLNGEIFAQVNSRKIIKDFNSSTLSYDYTIRYKNYFKSTNYKIPRDHGKYSDSLCEKGNYFLLSPVPLNFYSKNLIFFAKRSCRLKKPYLFHCACVLVHWDMSITWSKNQMQ